MTNRGALLLAEYLRARRIRRCEFADRIGRVAPLVTMWCKGVHCPGPDNRSLIRKATHGRVPVRSWDEEAA